MSPAPTLVKDDDDELDPELVSLRRRLPIGPLLAASVLGFALLMMLRLRADFAYARQPETPIDLGRIRAAARLPDNAHVSFIGENDAWAPARLRGIQNTGHRLTAVLGTAGRVWVHEPGEAITVTPTYDGRFSGRLRQLDDTPFADALRRYVAALPPRPHFIFPETLTDRLPALDVHGEPIAVTGDTAVAIEQRVAGLAIVTMVKTDAVVDQASAAGALAAAGLEARPGEQSATSWSFEVSSPPAEVAAKLRQARIFGASADPKIVEHSGRAADLAVTADAVTLAGTSVPRSAIDHIEVRLPQQIPADAWVLLAGDTPARLWYMPHLYAGLAVIALLMGWALAVAIRQLRKQRAHSPV